MYAGFVTAHGVGRLPDLMRYLIAADRRLQQLPHRRGARPDADGEIHEMRDEYAVAARQFPRAARCRRQARDIRWMIEELRVSYFAHALGTAYPVSDKRIIKAVDAAVPAAR